MPVVQYPSLAFPTNAAAGVVAGGSVYIGVVNDDPTVLANRIDVTVIQQDGTPVVIHPAAQPFTLSPGGLFNYSGAVVQLRTDTDYSMSVYSPLTGTTDYFPTASISSSISTDVVVMAARVDDPDPIADSGQAYTKVVSGKVEDFYMNDIGEVVQITNGDALNVDLGSTTVTADGFVSLSVITSPVYKAYPRAVTVSAGNVTFNLDLATVFYVTISADCTATFVAADITKAYSFSVVVTTTGAYNFTSLTMSGVTIYHGLGTDNTLQSTGVTAFGCLYNGAAATLFLFKRFMTT